MTLSAVAGAAAQNQPPQRPPQGMPPMGGGNAGAGIGDRGAQMLLARSAQLELTDAQVTRLAGIARRAEARRRSMRAAMDSARTRFTQPGDSLARRQFGQRMQADMQKERDQSRIDLRDAITVLTPDQQAKAWEMNAARSGARGAMRGRAGGMQRGGRDGRGFGPGDRRGPGGMRPGGMGPGGDMGPRGQMGPGGQPGAPGDMRQRRPARPPFDEFTGERNPT
jgi:hypothetical protein